MTLIKCEECGKEISDNSKTCIHCGIEIVKKVKCKDCGKLTAESNKVCEFCGCPIKTPEKQKKQMIKMAVPILIAIAMILIIIVIVTTIINNNKDKKMESLYRDTYYLLLEISNKTEVVASDLYNSWYYGIYEDYHSKTYLSYEVSLSYSDLNNWYCNQMLYNDEWIYCVQCIKTAHEDLGNYNKIKKILDKAKQKLSEMNDKSSEKYKELNSFYIILTDYYKVAKEYDGNFNSLTTTMSNHRNNIQNSISKLDLILNIDSEEYLNSLKNSNSNTV